jgi:hypothetical protein
MHMYNVGNLTLSSLSQANTNLSDFNSLYLEVTILYYVLSSYYVFNSNKNSINTLQCLYNVYSVVENNIFK